VDGGTVPKGNEMMFLLGFFLGIVAVLAASVLVLAFAHYHRRP